ncbi:alpha/beta hydrolase [Caballeronia sp. LZ043]|uniref:alpha/beta fold hydrolase n=1 Tax=Caballeronia sp. LZ043 TaxID=3038569 RepID=UPI0028591ACA|nr:alpha/beta hydrolase [Caballeronia sp. LZ043]MDR5826201.1 alpha/beta hydrolase [Caballeronia sp. LZ043]
MSEGFFITSDGCRLAYVDEGKGLPVFWQHGLGADRKQPAEVFPSIPGIRRITLECRGHGASELGDSSAISIEQFSSDLIALCDHLSIKRAAIGGISLGAAVALRIAVLHPGRVSALILARPAWVSEDAPPQLRIYNDVSVLLETYGIEEGSRRFGRSELLQEIEVTSPDNANSLRSFFARPNTKSTIQLLSRIPLQGPGVGRQSISHLVVPTLIIACGEDFVHPISTALALKELISGANFQQITSKTVNRDRYVSEFESVIKQFVGQLPSKL